MFNKISSNGISFAKRQTKVSLFLSRGLYLHQISYRGAYGPWLQQNEAAGWTLRVAKSSKHQQFSNKMNKKCHIESHFRCNWIIQTSTTI